jgi:hypothetical protein
VCSYLIGLIGFPCPACLKNAEGSGMDPSSVIFCPLVQVIFVLDSSISSLPLYLDRTLAVAIFTTRIVSVSAMTPR